MLILTVSSSEQFLKIYNLCVYNTLNIPNNQLILLPSKTFNKAVTLQLSLTLSPFRALSPLYKK